MAFMSYRDDGTDERRLGRRVPADALEIAWVLPKPAGLSLRRGPREAAGTMLDVSLTGAAISGPASLPFEVGATVLFRHRGHDCSAIVRRRRPTEDRATDEFGVELVVVHPTLMREIQRRVTAARADPQRTTGHPG